MGNIGCIFGFSSSHLVFTRSHPVGHVHCYLQTVSLVLYINIAVHIAPVYPTKLHTDITNQIMIGNRIMRSHVAPGKCESSLQPIFPAFLLQTNFKSRVLPCTHQSAIPTNGQYRIFRTKKIHLPCPILQKDHFKPTSLY